MKEKEIMKSELYDIKKIRNIIFEIGIGITIFWIIVYVIPGISDLSELGVSAVGEFILFHTIVPLLPFFIAGIIFYICASKINLVVTNKRVYGTAIFGKIVDLPFDKISAVATIGLLKGISVSTSSGAIRFIMIKNAGEVYNSISQLLIKRQKDNKKEEEITQNSRSTTDELREYKKLLDENIITQEEYDKKKKELLNLK